MRKIIYPLFAVSLLFLFTGCNKNKKLAKMDGNNKEYKETPVELSETIYIQIPNTILGSSLSGWGACQSIPFGQQIDYTAFVPTQNPNPYAGLVRNINPTKVVMELASVESCDFSMLGNLTVYICDKGVTDPANFVFPNPSNPDAAYNAIKLGEMTTIPESIGRSLTLPLASSDIIIDQFIHAGDFQIYTEMTIDKAFTDAFATIRTTMDLKAELDNEK